MDEREHKINILKEYFEKRDDVVMAFLFGSQAKGMPALFLTGMWGCFSMFGVGLRTDE